MASKRRVRRKSCEKKVRHNTAHAAHLALKKTVEFRGYSGPMNVYQCQFCGGWHVGHVQGNRKLTNKHGTWEWRTNGAKR